jgi:DNA-binding NarL/FixJ family response regulator
MGDVMARLVQGVDEREPRFTEPFQDSLVESNAELFPAARWPMLGAALRLTPRQVEIARHLCQGGTYKSIAMQSGISINTVRMHMRALFAKLGAHDRVTAVIQIVLAERALPLRSRQSHTES